MAARSLGSVAPLVIVIALKTVIDPVTRLGAIVKAHPVPLLPGKPVAVEAGFRYSEDGNDDPATRT